MSLKSGWEVLARKIFLLPLVLVERSPAFSKRFSSRRMALVDSPNSVSKPLKYEEEPEFRKNFRRSLMRVREVIKVSNILEKEAVDEVMK